MSIQAASESGKGEDMLLREILKATEKHAIALMKEIIVLIKEESKKDLDLKIDKPHRFL
ncbi:MAG: hypothetical protein KAI50_04450 [Desulfobacterales bacterium]|nr:hypothetical protein [Desulfobacterales bacterium]